MAGFPRPKQRRAEAARRRCLMQAAAAAGAVLFLYLLVSLGRTASSPGGGPSEQALASPTVTPGAESGGTWHAEGISTADDAAAAAPSGGALRPYCGHMRSASDLAGVGAAEGIEACIHDRGPAPPLGILSETASGKWACLPSFVIMGAGKSGTTTLAAALNDHPQVPSKEGKGYSTSFFVRSDAWERMEEYAEGMHIPELPEGEQQIVFEKTAFYYNTIKGACNVRMLLPQSKIVYAIRDPVNRTMSEFEMYNIVHTSDRLQRYRRKLGKGEAKLTLEEAREAMAELAGEQRAECEHLRGMQLDQPWDSMEIVEQNTDKRPSLDEPEPLTNGTELSHAITNSLYWAHLYRWVKAGHRAEDMCIVVLEHVESDYTRAMTELFTCLGLDVPDEEWMAAHDYTEFKKNEGRMNRDPEEMFNDGPRKREKRGTDMDSIAEAMEGTARDMYDIAYPVLAESADCFREVLREKAPLMFGDDARRLQELVPPSVDLQALWGLP